MREIKFLSPSASFHAEAEVKWDTYTYKFGLTGTMAQVFENGKVVGTVLIMNGNQQVVPLPGTD